jgi:hypothetical protein
MTSAASDPQFDIFISYRHKDRGWVEMRLLPQLERLAIGYAVDWKHFDMQRPVDQEVTRLIRASRQTLAVVTRDWASSAFTEFEVQLERATAPGRRHERVIVLRVEPCNLPATLGGAAVIDMTALPESTAWQELHRLVVEARTLGQPLATFDVRLKLWRTHSASNPLGVEYFAEILVGNGSSADLRFDSIDFEILGHERATPAPQSAKHAHVRLTNGGVSVSYCYNQCRAQAAQGTSHSVGEGTPRVVTLGGNRAITLHSVQLGPLQTATPGRDPLGLAISLSLGGTKVTRSCTCALPPVVRLPLFGSEGGLPIDPVPDSFLLGPAGILDRPLVAHVFETAAQFAQDRLLARVAPELLTTLTMATGEQLHAAHNWRFEFFSQTMGGGFSVMAVDPGRVESRGKMDIGKPQTWLTEDLLAACRADSTAAYLIAQQSGATTREPGWLSLEAIRFGGIWRPAWRLPLLFQRRPALVLADSGELCTEGQDGLRKAERVMWNG